MADKMPSVLLVSIDALKPELVERPEQYGVALPNLTRLRGAGVFAGGGVKSVFPSFTYPCHQSIVTGTHPATHGICNNVVFDPVGKHQGAWNWFVSERVPTLWEMAGRNGYCVGNAAFPASVGAPGDFMLPEFWRDGTDFDGKFIHAVGIPHDLGKDAENAIGRLPSGLDLTPEGDRKRRDLALWLLRTKLRPKSEPYFMTAYFASYDEMAHIHGVYAPQAMRALEAIDKHVGDLAAEAEGIVCVVSDHGTLNVTHCIHPNALFCEAGLIQADAAGKVSIWQAWSQRAGGIAEVRLADPGNKETADKVEGILRGLAADPDSGVEEILTGREAREKRHGFSEADFVIVAKRGHEIRDDFAKPYKTHELVQKAQHGFSENYEEMRASFLIAGEGIPQGVDAGAMELVDIAPTLAELMGFSLPDAEGKSIAAMLGR